jgi:hypothetical protein
MSAGDHERCEACGFDGSSFGDAALLSEIRSLGARWRALIATAGPALRVRPAPGVWSAIEYAAHSRDVTALHCFGVEQALTEDEPAYPAIDGENLVQSASTGYRGAEPSVVVDAIDELACRLARLAAGAPAAAWRRGLTIGDHRMTVRRLLEHALHDSTHHLDDVQRGLSRAGSL